MRPVSCAKRNLPVAASTASNTAVLPLVTTARRAAAPVRRLWSGALLLAGLLAARLQAFVRRPLVRRGAGLLVLGFGVWGLVGAVRLALAL